MISGVCRRGKHEWCGHRRPCQCPCHHPEPKLLEAWDRPIIWCRTKSHAKCPEISAGRICPCPCHERAA